MEAPLETGTGQCAGILSLPSSLQSSSTASPRGSIISEAERARRLSGLSGSSSYPNGGMRATHTAGG